MSSEQVFWERGGIPRVRLYRSGALTGGVSGALTSLPWDATSARMTKLGVSHDTATDAEVITIDEPGLWRWLAVVRFASALLVSAIGAEIQIDGGAGYVAAGRGSQAVGGSAILVSVESAVSVFASADLVPGDLVRVQFAATGAASAALVAGEAETYLEGYRLS